MNRNGQYCQSSLTGDSLAYLSNILVPNLADLLDICRTLRNAFERVAQNNQLVLLRLRDFKVDARLHHDASHDLFADKVPVGRFVSLPTSNNRQAEIAPSTYRISTSNRPVSLFFSTLTLMGKCA